MLTPIQGRCNAVISRPSKKFIRRTLPRPAPGIATPSVAILAPPLIISHFYFKSSYLSGRRQDFWDARPGHSIASELAILWSGRLRTEVPVGFRGKALVGVWGTSFPEAEALFLKFWRLINSYFTEITLHLHAQSIDC